MWGRANSFKQNQPVYKNTGGNPLWVQPGARTRARQLKKHISKVKPRLSAMRAKQTQRPGLATSASVRSLGLL